ILDLARESAKENGDRVYIREKAGKDIRDKSFNDFYRDACRVCGFVNEVRSGGEPIHAAVIGPSSYAWIVSYFGTVFGGNTAVPLDALLNPEGIIELLNRSDSSIFFYDARYEKLITILKQHCPAVAKYVCINRAAPAENPADIELADILEKYAPDEPAPVSPDALAAISYTSGTTGKSKGVMLLNRNFIDNTMCQDNESTPEDVVMSVLPIHHIYCFTCDILLSMRYGSQLCINDSLMHIAQNLKLYQPTIMLVVPMIAKTIYKQIQAAAAAKPEIPVAAIANAVFGGRLKLMYSGGAYLSPELQKAYYDMGIRLLQGYGMTECAPRIACKPVDCLDLLEDVGTLVNGCSVKIEDGEILVKSPSVMAGYYKDPEETAKSLTPDGWLRTGDLGYVDDHNRLFLTGRKKNLIILSGGENVSPEELENKFDGLDIVAEVMVYDDDDVLCAEIFPNKDICGGMPEEELAKLLEDELAKINRTLPASKAMRRIRLRDAEFDKTTSKKMIRNQTTHGKII
ncbi:MAG: AMP-binding protein, partial [Oscillospiraceae bacterium]